MEHGHDLTLSDGREITFDLTKITMREYRQLFSYSQLDEEGDALIGKSCGLTGDEIGGLSYLDYREVLRAFFQKAREPLADPA